MGWNFILRGPKLNLRNLSLVVEYEKSERELLCEPFKFLSSVMAKYKNLLASFNGRRSSPFFQIGTARILLVHYFNYTLGKQQSDMHPYE